MARRGFVIEKLLEIVGENTDSGVQLLFGSAAPGGDTGEQDDAPIGSAFFRLDTFNLYIKLADANAAADWYTYGSLYSISGTSQGDVDMGAFTGGILSDASNIKSLFQEMSDFIEQNIAEDDSADGVTTEQVIDDELVDEVLAVTYHVVVSLNSAPAQRRSFHVVISHDGTVSADATATDDSVYAKTKHGSPFNYTLSTGVSGAAGAQVMQLKLASTEIGGVDVRCRKISQVSA